MRSISSRLSPFALALLVLLPLSASAEAQTETGAETASPGDITGIIDEVLAARDETQNRIRRIGEQIDAKTTEIDEAGTLFDEMIEALREQAAIGDPGGNFVKRIERLEELARADADAARAAGYSDFEAEFLEDAEAFSEQKRVALSEYEALERRIRAVNAERERVVFLIKLRRYDEAQSLVDKGLGQLRELDGRLSEIEAGLRQIQGTPGIID